MYVYSRKPIRYVPTSEKIQLAIYKNLHLKETNILTKENYLKKTKSGEILWRSFDFIKNKLLPH